MGMCETSAVVTQIQLSSEFQKPWSPLDLPRPGDNDTGEHCPAGKLCGLPAYSKH